MSGILGDRMEEKKQSVDSGLSTIAVAASVVAVAFSIMFFVNGLHRIERHDRQGWWICIGCSGVFCLHLYRLVKLEITAHRQK